MDFEEGSLSDSDVLHLFSYLVKTGKAWALTGVYGRTANDLIRGGYLDRQGNILKEV